MYSFLNIFHSLGYALQWACKTNLLIIYLSFIGYLRIYQINLHCRKLQLCYAVLPSPLLCLSVLLLSDLPLLHRFGSVLADASG